MASVLRNPVYMTYPSTAHRVRHVRRTDPLAEAASADEDSVCRAVEFRVYDRDPDPSLIPDDLLRDDSSSSSEDDDDSIVIGPPEHLDAEEDDDEDHHEPYRIENRSRNLVDFQNARQTGPGRFEHHSVEDEYVTRYLLTHNMLTEHVIRLDRLDKVFSAEWLSDRQVVFGTKCNKLMVYNVIQRKVEQIPSLARPIITAAPSARKRRKLTQLAASLDNNPEVKGGIHAVRINKSKTLLVTGGKQSCDVAVYALPTFDPVYVGAGAHDDLIFDITWIDDQVFVSGSRDSTLAIWKVPSKDLRNVDSDELPRCQLRTPVLKQKCMMGEKVRTMGFNPKYPEIVAVSMNAYIHLFDPFTLKQKYSRKLPHLVENVCVAVDELKDVYAIGSKSHATLIDARTLTPTEKIGSRMHGCGIRSLSFLGNLLTMGTGMGQISFYDLRAKKFLESSVQTGRCVTLKMSHGTVVSDEAAPADLVAGDSVPAIYTHCYDYTGTRLFAAGGPLQVGIQGNYASVWQ